MADKALLEFPTNFPVKVFGPNTEAFIEAIAILTTTHFPTFDPKRSLHQKPSAKSNYIAITLNLYVESQIELDAFYRALNQHPDTKMVL